MNSVDWVHADTPVCVSGGAVGADNCWALNAAKNNHKVVIISFRGYTPTDIRPYTQKIITLTEQDLNQSAQALEEANLYLSRTNLNFTFLKRDFFQIKFTKSLYVVSRFTNGNKRGSVRLEGGSAWATQMFLVRYCYAHGSLVQSSSVKVPMYLFEMTTNLWYQGSVQMKDLTVVDFKWKVVDQIPNPSGYYSAIGAREITLQGKKAIDSIFSKY